MGQGTNWHRDPGEPRENDVTAQETAEYSKFENDEFSENLGYSKYFMHALSVNGRIFPGNPSKQQSVKRVPITDSKIAKWFIDFLRTKSINVNVGNNLASTDELFGFWNNDFNQIFVQSGSVFETSDGTEYLK